MVEQERLVIDLPYEPRSQFLSFHNRTKRFACLVVHRRGGKTVASINDLIKRNIECTKEAPRFAYIAPYHAQAKDVAWEYLKRYSAPIPGVSFNESELRVDYPNGGRIRLYGAENAERMRGLYFDGVVIDEPADINPRVWPEIVRPALADRQGSAVFIGTPKGHNAFYEIYDSAKSNSEWFSMTLKASESQLLSQSELDAAQAAMTEDQYAQEFECSFEAAIQGAYYAKELSQAEADGRIGNVPYDPKIGVTTAWDLGIDDATSIWFCQQVGREVRIVDHYESSGVGLDHYTKILSEKPYTYIEHILPHDAEVKELGTGHSRLQTLYNLGLKARVLKANKVEDGINAVRGLIPQCWFDKTKCAKGLEALRQYRTEWDDKNKTFRNKPLHDWTSHAADAFRYLSVGLRDNSKKKWQQPSTKWVV